MIAASSTAVWAVMGALLSTSCAPTPTPLTPETTAELRAGRARLEALRAAAAPKTAHTLRVALSLREPFTGKVLRARGAVAVSPPDALRMILVGPGGTTALDLWAKGDRFRFAVPAIGLVKRGDSRTPRTSMRGMPVDFLRWWMLQPAGGKLLWHARTASGDRFVLRDGRAVIDLVAADDGHLEASRATWERGEDGVMHRLEEERVHASGVGCATIAYEQRSTGLKVDVSCEGEEREHAPSERAFTDPDATGSAP